MKMGLYDKIVLDVDIHLTLFAGCKSFGRRRNIWERRCQLLAEVRAKPIGAQANLERGQPPAWQLVAVAR